MPATDPQTKTAVPPAKDTGGLDEALVRERARAALFATGTAPHVGRYQLLERLGAGGMGVVFAAYDAELDRRVAVKLLHPGGGEGTRDRMQARLRREAQALARAQHPNVVTVYEVGRHEDQLYVAMEYVAGQTLKAWLETGKRTQTEIRRVFAQAGRGLLAAHAHGLVHRDFKPDNVLVGDDGRVRVADFGLARSGSAATESSSEAQTEDGNTAGLAGTPAYMAPEQFEGGELDARTDQFAFCVALYEALYDERPFPGDSVETLRESVRRGEIRRPSAGTSVPTRLVDAIVRGLSPDPDNRWPSLTPLVERLQPKPRRGGLWAIPITAAAAGLAWWAGRTADPACDPEPGLAKLESVWSSARAQSLRSAFMATDVGHAAQTWQRVERSIGRYGEAWTTSRLQACEDFRSGAVSATLHDRGMACLDRRLATVDALLEVFAAADVAVVARATSAVANLPPLSRCTDPDLLLAEVPPPDDPDAAAKAEQIETQLARALAQRIAGRYQEALATADAVREPADQIGHLATVAEVALTRGLLLAELGHDDAAQVLESAFFTAREADHEWAAGQAAVRLAAYFGVTRDQYDAARLWAKHASASVAQTHDRDATLRLLSVEGSILSRSGDSKAALRKHEELIAAAGSKGDDSAGIVLGTAYTNMGLTLGHLDRDEEAVAAQRTAVSYRESTVGPDHPETANAYNNLAMALKNVGRQDEAIETLEKAIALKKSSLGPRHQSVADSLANLGLAYRSKGELDRALELLVEAQSIFHETVGSDSVKGGAILQAIADTHAKMGNHALALEEFERSIALRRGKLPDDHPVFAMADAKVVRVLEQLGRYDEAATRAEKAIAGLSAAFGPDSPRVQRLREHVARMPTGTP